MAGTNIPGMVPPQLFTDAGAVAAGLKLFTYVAGTTTKATTYTDSALSSANTNPITLDSAGRCTIFVPERTSWKLVLAPADTDDPPTSPIWTRDDLPAIPLSTESSDITGTAGENLSSGDCCYLSQGDGSRTAGRWYKADADLTYGSITAKKIAFATAAISTSASGVLRTSGRVAGLSGLVAGTSYYISATAGVLTSTAPDLARFVGVADSGTSLVIDAGVADDLISSDDTDVRGLAGEAIAAGEVAYLSDGSGGNDAGKWYLADADNTYSSTAAVRIAVAPYAIASGGTGVLRLDGLIVDGSLTAGAAYYVSATAGALTTTPPANAALVGFGDVNQHLALAAKRLSVVAPAGTGTSAGPAVLLQAGASGSGATGNGGPASLIAGAAASTNGTGGQTAATGGAGTGTGSGGAVALSGGTGGSTSGVGGAVTATGGTGGGSGVGGAATFAAGAGGATNAAGGIASLTGGAGTGTGDGGGLSVAGGASGSGATGDGGDAAFLGGDAASTNGGGGFAHLIAGDATGTGTAGEVTIQSGDSAGASGTAGDVTIDTGAASGGTEGSIQIGSAGTKLIGFYGATPVDQPAHIADPSGGGTQDAEARTAVDAIIDALKELGLLAPDP